MKSSYTIRSLVVLIVSIVILIILTVADPVLAGTSIATQRLITFVGLILIPLSGSVLAILGLVRRDGRTWIASICLIGNTLFALFHLALVFFAG